ncbi:alpha/beta hydrolase [Microbacterium sp. NPDC089189]|uniref:alpha/beta fold hydrolase n=1 Tax=Microbacterium sp. NPDC089189 TaxID=3154972 RepID=UPI00341CD090
MKRPLKRALVTVGVILAIPALLVATSTVANAVATHVEASDIEPYGRLIPVDGKRMNVVEAGDGAETIVLLPGLGTAAPGLDFGPLIDDLSRTHRVIALEPFGTGLSDQTATARTAANIVRELHEALRFLDVDRFVLMGHSIAGIYALAYSEAYADELIAFVGIDSSVPDQPGAGDPIPTELMVVLANLGITRALGALAEDPYDGLDYDPGTVRQMSLLTTRNTTASTMVDEMDRAGENFASVSGRSFPAELPVLLFVRSNDTDVEGWVALHEAQAASVVHGEVVTLEGDHYLHHTLAERITHDTTAFLADLPTP